MTGFFNKSLQAQIKEAEQQVLKHRRMVDHSASALILTINRQMISPASLLLAGSIGFIIGELTQKRTSKFCKITQNPHTAEMTPLKTALKFVALARTVYAILPLARIVSAMNQKNSPHQVQEDRSPQQQKQ